MADRLPAWISHIFNSQRVWVAGQQGLIVFCALITVVEVGEMFGTRANLKRTPDFVKGGNISSCEHRAFA